MLLYHYAGAPYTSLRTLKHRDPAYKDERTFDRHEPGSYGEHISFFLEPAPLDILGKLYSDVRHSLWVEGKTVYEHIVQSSNILSFSFMLVETPFDYAFMDEHWPVDAVFTDAEKESYFKELAKQKQRRGLVGNGNSAFERTAKQFLGKTRQAFISRAAVNNQEDKMRYATGVPHVMLYPKPGEVKLLRPPVSYVIGQKRTVHSNENYPASARW